MNQTANKVLDIFQDFRMSPTVIDQYESKGKEVLLSRIEAFINKNEEIKFSMLGYPFKSQNERDKVIGPLPDLGEELSLKNFETFTKRIQSVYSPGARITIVSDGLAFSDVVGISDVVTAEYYERTVDMSNKRYVEFLDIRDFYPGLNLHQAREKLLTQFLTTEQELQSKILFDANVNELYRGMIKFQTLEMAIQNWNSKTQLQNAAKKMARQMMFRNESFSKMVQSEMSGHIRLSMHNSTNDGTKYSFQLIPSPKAWTSPWHCAILVNSDGEIETIHRKDVNLQTTELVYQNGQAYYFQTIK